MKRTWLQFASLLIVIPTLGTACGDDSGGTASTSASETTGSMTDEAGEAGSMSGESGSSDSMSGSSDTMTSEASTGDGDGDSASATGDGDGDTASATGDGDGDTTSATGDGDGDTTGDGDGDATSATGDGDGDGDGDSTGATGDGDGDGDGVNWWDVPNEPPCPPDLSADAVLTGTALAPDGLIPVSEALVYTSPTVPAGVPAGVHCADCVELDCGAEHGTLSGVDGSFSLNVSSGDKYLVVQKGQFLRYTPLTVVAGTQAVDVALTTLPNEWDPANGEFIPRIAIADGSYDRLEDALGKMGLGDTVVSAFEERLVPGSESFELWNNGRDPVSDGLASQGNFLDLLNDPTRMATYHIIFVPCSTSDVGEGLSATQIQNIRDWVAAGGRWYVADWSGDFMAEVFPEYQTFFRDSSNDVELGSFDSDGVSLDATLSSWLDALPAALKDINPFNDTNGHPTLNNLPIIPTVDNFSGVQYPLPVILVDDGQGGFINTGHRAWLEGPGDGFEVPASPNHPLTVAAQFGCGRIQFTSYHAAEFENYVGMTPQELVLMYTILEIGVCQGEVPLPQ